MYFIPKEEVPFETHRTRITVGGNLLEYAGTLTTPTETITTAKCLFNSVVSTPKEKCVLAYIKNIYLNNALPDPEYMKFHISTIPQEIINEYNLLDIVDNHGFVYVKIVKGIYGLKQAGIIAHKAPIHHLAPFGYHPACHTPGLCQRETRDTIFTIVVDNFVIKYTSLENAKHLLMHYKQNIQYQKIGRQNSTSESPYSGPI